MGGGQFWGCQPDDRESIHTIQASLDLGINLVDTAPGYGFGRCEEVVGKAIRGRRSSVLVATKCGLIWDDPRGSFFAEFDGKRLHRSLRPDTIQMEVEKSLRHLGTDYIDLYQTHWPSTLPDKTPIEDTVACLMRLQQEGKIRAFGVSNVSLEELEENVKSGPIASDQFRYSMLHRDAEQEILPACAKHDLATLTYMSLEQGLLTGKVGMDRVFQPSEIRGNPDWNEWFVPENRQRVLNMLTGWGDLTRKYECSLAQLVIAWTAAQAGVTHVLVGARKLSQVTENAKAGSLSLESSDLQRIRQNVLDLGQPAKP